jgi:hypothetical protein
MLECARKVVRYTAHLTREQFFSSELEYDATLRNLEILGEAAKKVPDELKHQYPSVDWRGIAGFRDVLIELALTPSPSPTAWERGAARSPSPAWGVWGLGGEGNTARLPVHARAGKIAPASATLCRTDVPLSDPPSPTAWERG